MKPQVNPPRFALRFFRWFCHPALRDAIEGDLFELYQERCDESGKRRADLKFVIDVILLFRPGIIRPAEGYRQSTHYGMFKNYFTIGWRNMIRTKGYSSINIAGLAVGMAVVILISSWIYDELSFDRSHLNYDRLARVMVNHTFNGEISSQWAQPFPLGKELREKFNDDFDDVTMTSWSYGHFLEHDARKISVEGMYVEPAFLKMASIQMIQGSAAPLNNLRSIILDQSLARTMFGGQEPIGKIIKIDNFSTVSVTGVFKDLPPNSSFSSTHYLLPWDLYAADNEWVRSGEHNWGNFSYQTLVQLRPGSELDQVAGKIKDVIIRNNPRNESNPQLILHPMSKWHLYSDFRNGLNTGGAIQFVWLFGIIGAFVLLIACINFMNLSTARSEKRAKEVGLRKAIGSLRGQLIAQFLTESIFYALLAFAISLLLAQLSLSWFNLLADKQMTPVYYNPLFWFFGPAFVLITGLLAGSYPALYLSSFNPVKILKGNLKAGRSASIPRRALVVLQFSVSITLIIGTVVVYRQIMYAKNRPMGYDHHGLITTYGFPFQDNRHNPLRYESLKNQLIETGAVISMGKSSSPTTGAYSNQSDFEWEGKAPDLMPNFAVVFCSHDYGNTIGLQFVQGRPFSLDHRADTAGIILNEVAVRFMGLNDPIGKTVRYNHEFNLTITGVVKDVLMESPYEPIRPTVYMVDYNRAQILTLKLNPSMNAAQALSRVEPVFKKFNPESLFEYQFVDQEFNKKFIDEERLGKLSSVFAVLAIFISCLGIFGLASFVAEQRNKEIGIRKVLGASVIALWQMLSREFVALVVLSFIIAIPVSYYFLKGWLMGFAYHMQVEWWVFAAAGAGALLITLATVSFQSVKAALTNPIQSLKTE